MRSFCWTGLQNFDKNISVEITEGRTSLSNFKNAVKNVLSERQMHTNEPYPF